MNELRARATLAERCQGAGRVISENHHPTPEVELLDRCAEREDPSSGLSAHLVFELTTHRGLERADHEFPFLCCIGPDHSTPARRARVPDHCCHLESSRSTFEE